MIQEKITRTIFAVDVNGKVIPSTGLAAADIAFIDKDTSLEIRFSSFTENGNGSYTFDGFTEYNGSSWVALTTKHICNITIETVAQPQLGQVEIGADSLAYPVKTTETRLGVTTNIVDAGTRIITNVTAGTQADDAVNYGQVVKNTGNETINGNKTFEGRVYLGNNAVADNEPTTLLQVMEAIAGSAATPYQESGNMVSIIPDGVQVDGIIYKTLASGIDSFTSPAVTNQCMCLIKGTGAVTNMIALSHADLVSYVHIRGIGKHISLILGTINAAVSKYVNFERLTMYLGGGDITGDRTYTNFKFSNCIIFAYKNLTLSSCELDNVMVYMPANKKITLAGTTKANGLYCTQNIEGVETVIANGGWFIGEGNLNTTYTMPTDPTIAS